MYWLLKPVNDYHMGLSIRFQIKAGNVAFSKLQNVDEFSNI